MNPMHREKCRIGSFRTASATQNYLAGAVEPAAFPPVRQLNRGHASNGHAWTGLDPPECVAQCFPLHASDTCRSPSQEPYKEAPAGSRRHTSEPNPDCPADCHFLTSPFGVLASCQFDFS